MVIPCRLHCDARMAAGRLVHMPPHIYERNGSDNGAGTQCGGCQSGQFPRPEPLRCGAPWMDARRHSHISRV